MPLTLRQLLTTTLCLGALATASSCAAHDSGTQVAGQDLPGEQVGYTMQALPVAGGQHAVAVADLDGDSHPDIVFTLPNQGQLGILWNQGDKTFLPTTITVTGTPYSLAVVDLNGDMSPDVVFTDPSSHTLGILYTNPKGSVDRNMPFRTAQPVRHPTGPGSTVLQTGFLNGDSLPDVALLNIGDGMVSVYLNTGMGGMYDLKEPAPSYFAGPSHYSLALVPTTAADPVAQDVLVTSASEDTVTILRNDSNGVLAPDPSSSPTMVPAGPVAVAAVLDPARSSLGTGPTLIVYVASSSGNMISAYTQMQGVLTSAAGIPVTSRPVALAVGDLDHDTFPDLVAVNNGSDTLEVFLSVGPGQLARLDDGPLPTGQAPVAAVIADLNKDGRAEIIVASEQSAEVQIFWSKPPTSGARK